MKAIILAAGFAKRLSAQIENTPKSLLKIKNKPIIDYILERIDEIGGVEEKIIITNNKFHEQFLDWKQRKDVKIINNGVDKEEDKLGAVGDMLFVLKNENINEEILLIAGDTLIDFSLSEPMSIFRKDKLDVTIFRDLENFEEAKRFGVGTVEKNILVDFEEKPQAPKSTLCSVPIYFFKKETVELLKNFDGNLDNLGNILTFLYKKVQIYSYITNRNWIDIGTVESLREAEEFK